MHTFETFTNNILEIEDLSLNFKGNNPDTLILNHLSFSIREGEILGLIGNSGCGKSMTALSITGLLKSDAQIKSGSILFNNQDLLKLNDKEKRAIRGKEIGMIFQEPYTALDPLMNIYHNLEEVLIEHETLSKTERHDLIVKMLDRVGFTNSEEILNRFPHELSGGQRQRVLIAGAALLKPKLLIADEPTSSLDTVTSCSIMKLIKSLCDELNMSVLFISHDLSTVGNFCDRVLVMRTGEIVDSGSSFDILFNPKDAYTADLLTKSKFDPKVLNLTFNTPDKDAEPVIKVSNLCAGYMDRKGFKRVYKNILEDISFNMLPGEVVGLIGSSGCGKTTLTRALSGLIKPKSGTISTPAGRLAVVFQDPGTCLNPSYSVYWHLAEAIRAAKINMTKEELKAKATDTLVSVGLEPMHLDRYPSQLSGGQRQRVAIAMCLMLNPAIIIADEPLSSLDTTSGARILSILSSINREFNTSILLISHNLRIVKATTSRVLVMNEGKIVESGNTQDVLTNPQSDTTKELLDAEITLHKNFSTDRLAIE